MKKLLSIVLVIGMLMSVMSLSVSAANDAELTDEEITAMLTTMTRADVDGNGSYSTLDATILLKAAAGIEASQEDYDIDLDGQVSLLDAQKMLRVAANLENVVDNQQMFKLFKQSLNNVKKVKPGFNRTTTLVCPTIKVTTTGAPISKLNVSNMEYKDYVSTFVSAMNTFPYNSLLDDEMKAELELMKQSAVDIYKPQTEKKVVAATSNSHYTYFPVNNLGWSCNLDYSEIESITQTVADGKIVLTITLADATYGKSAYPTGTSGFSERQKLTYGKIFNLPALNENDGSVVNSMKLNDGVVVLKLDPATGKAAEVDYSYTYISDITSPKSEGSDLVMRTVTTVNTAENYVMK